MSENKGVKLTDIDRIKSKKKYKSAVSSARSAVFLILFISFLVFVAIAAYAIWNEGLANFLSAIESMNLWYLLLAFVVTFISYAMRFPKWSLYLEKLGVHIPVFRNFVIYMSMYSMDITPGRWGRAIVSYTINKISKVKFAVTFPAVVADIFTDFLGFAILADATALVVGKFVLLSFVITTLLIVPFLFVYIQGPFEYVKKRYFKYKKRFKVLSKLDIVVSNANMYFKNNRRLGWGPFVFSMFLTVPSMFLNGMALFIVMKGFGVPVVLSDIPTVIFIFSSALVLGMLSNIPGTLGVTDAALVSGLEIFFPDVIGLSLASAITIMFRIVTVWFVEGFGFASLLYTMKFWKDE